MNIPAGHDVSQEVRRETLFYSLIFLFVVGGLLVMANEQPPPSLALLGLLLLGLATLVLWLRIIHHRASAWVLIVGLLSLTLLGAVWYPDTESPYLLVFPVVIALTTIGPLAALGTAVLATGAVYALARYGYGAAHTATVLELWCLSAFLLLSYRPLRTVINWALEGYTHAQMALEQARDRQVELKQALEDLALANRETIRLNEMLSAARKAVEDARRAKEEFVANVSHELRTPLNMIIGFSDMILEAPEVYAHRLPNSLLADVSAIRRNSQHLATLVDDVLDLSEVDTGHIQLFKEECTFPQIAQEAVETVRALFTKKGLALTLDTPDDLPPIYCDRTRIRQVLLNLLSNAGRFTEKGGARVGAKVEGGRLVISVSDTGPGMQHEKIGRLFEPFQQADPSTRRRYGGSGLGLAISKRFVELHGGKIWLESELGRGTTAAFSLPLTHDLDGEPSKRWFDPYHEYTPRSRRADLPELRTNPRVVVMERGEALCRLIGHHARELEPVLVHSLEEASYAVEANAAQALLINWGSVVAPAEQLAALPPMSFSVPILSCWIPERETILGTLGVQDYLVKPVTRASLFSSLARVAPHASSVLITDDDLEAQRLFGRMLASAEREYKVFHARGGQSALKLLRERRPDVMLLDLVMSDMDGWAVLEAKAADERMAHIPVIILSAKDPQREPVVSKLVALSRPEGLSAQDLVQIVEATTCALKPRFGALARPERIGASSACT